MERNFLYENIDVCVELATKYLQSTLGPFGRDKMFKDSQENILITNDGATYLKMLALQHPIAIILRQISCSQDNSVGDGTTSAVLLTCYILKECKKLMIEKPVMPIPLIIRTLEFFKKFSLQRLDDCSIPINVMQHTSVLSGIIKTCFSSKIVGVNSSHNEYFTKLFVDTFLHVMQSKQQQVDVFHKKILFEKWIGSDICNSKSYKNTLFVPLKNFEFVKFALQQIDPTPSRILFCKISNLCSLKQPRVANTQFVEEDVLEITEADKQRMEVLCQKIIQCQVRFVINFETKPIHPLVQSYLWEKAKIICIGGLSPSYMSLYTNALPCQVILSTNGLENPLSLPLLNCISFSYTSDSSQSLHYLKMQFESTLFSFATITFEAPNAAMLDEGDRAFHDALRILEQVVGKTCKVVGAAGSMYMDLSIQLKNHQITQLVSGKQQLILEAIANALEMIPTILAVNAGYDASSLIAELRMKHLAYQQQTTSQISKNCPMGINLISGKIEDAISLRREDDSSPTIVESVTVVEPVQVMRNIITNAIEAAEMILRIETNVYQFPLKSARDLGIV